jgi:hypothetical protein
VLWTHTREFYELTTQYMQVEEMVGHVLKGRNATIFAYGQTGSGKTHTMGTAERRQEDGVLQSIAYFLFSDENAGKFTIKLSCVQLYLVSGTSPLFAADTSVPDVDRTARRKWHTTCLRLT